MAITMKGEKFLKNVVSVIKCEWISLKCYKSKTIAIEFEIKGFSPMEYSLDEFVAINGGMNYLEDYKEDHDELKWYDFLGVDSFVILLPNDEEIILYGETEWLNLKGKGE